MTRRPRQSGAPAAALALLAAAALAATLLGGGSARGAAGAPLLAVGVEVVNASASDATYSIVVTNHGTGPATSLRVADTVPAQTTFGSSVPAPSPPAGGGAPACANGGGAEAAGTICEWALPDLGPGESARIDATLGLIPSQNDFQVTNTAQATAAGSYQSTDTDGSLNWYIPAGDAGVQDTYVDGRELADFNHGGCNVLRIRRDDSATSFIRAFNQNFRQHERLWAAQLRLVTATPPTTPGVIEAHEILSGWSEGTGSCIGAVGTGDQPRVGLTPPSSADPTATATVPAQAGQVMTLDVTADLDTPEERTANKGWELKDVAPGDGEAVTALHSSEATGGNTAVLAVVYTQAEAPSCVDVDPGTSSATSDQERALTVQVTDGARVSSEAGDACTGGAAAGQRVDWQFEDESPDAYFSRRGTTETFGQPNSIITAVDAQGLAGAGVRLAAHTAGDTRVSARLEDAADPDTCPQVPTPCPTEVEDDAVIQWTANPPQASPSTGGGGGTSTNTSTAPPALRTVSVNGLRTVDWGSPAGVTGHIDGAAACVAGQKVQLVQVTLRGVVSVARISTSATGAFRFASPIPQGGTYAVVAERTSTCVEASSARFDLLARPDISLSAFDSRVPRGAAVKLRGGVEPRLRRGTLVLQRRQGRRWVSGRRVALRGGAYVLRLRATWRGVRVFRLRYSGSRRDGLAAAASPSVAVVSVG